MPVRRLSPSTLALIALAAILSACAADAQNAASKDKGSGDRALNSGSTTSVPVTQTAAREGLMARYGSSASASAACLARMQKSLDEAAAAQQADSTRKVGPGHGRDPVFARTMGWFPKMPPFRDGSLLPCSRIVAYYGNPREKKMGVLGEYPKDEMFRRFDAQLEAWRKADPSTPVIPAFHLVAVVAQGAPGKAGKYRMIMPDTVVNEVYGWAKQKNALFIVDVQVGQDRLQNVLPHFEWVLKNPDVELAIDPEFSMHYSSEGTVPGRKIGTFDASDVNYASTFLEGIVDKYNLPPKLLIVHRFTRRMVTNARNIQLRPHLQIVMDMDGWGDPWLKYDSYWDYIVKEPVQFTGWKGFYHNDERHGTPILKPTDIVKLYPKPLYVQYQ